MATSKHMAAALDAARAAVAATAQPGSTGPGGVYRQTVEEAAAELRAEEVARLAAEQGREG